MTGQRMRAVLVGLALSCLAACAPQPAGEAPASAVRADAATPVASAPAAPSTPAAPPSIPAIPVEVPTVEEPVDAPAPQPAPQAGSLLTTCQADTDCAVKDVGSCCGYRPACVSQDARPDPAAVQARCAQEGRVGICGFQEIESCQCVSGKCEASPGTSGPAAPVRLQ